tara:strand:+ start:808 stop:1209 length:402 start_codon:yes stop_codon:yes gene_type:complete
VNNMAHYAFLDENNIVTEVIVGKEENENGIDWEQHYGNFRKQTCKRTSYNTHGGVHNNKGIPFRKNYAEIGYTYDEDRDAFIPRKPYNSWVLNEDTCNWEPTIAMPGLTQEQIDNKNFYTWNEENQSWTLQPI